MNKDIDKALKDKFLCQTRFTQDIEDLVKNNKDLNSKLSNHGIKIQGKQIFVENFNDPNNLFEINNLILSESDFWNDISPFIPISVSF